jgi:uncharacterized protein YbbK (DUF523 family)
MCPEELGGLSTPRPPAEISEGDGHDVLDGSARLLRSDGSEVTAEFVAGAQAVLREVKERGIKVALLKSKSPSCGAGTTHAGGQVVSGYGVCAALLLREGIEVMELG